LPEKTYHGTLLHINHKKISVIMVITRCVATQQGGSDFFILPYAF